MAGRGQAKGHAAGRCLQRDLALLKPLKARRGGSPRARWQVCRLTGRQVIAEERHRRQLAGLDHRGPDKVDPGPPTGAEPIAILGPTAIETVPEPDRIVTVHRGGKGDHRLVGMGGPIKADLAALGVEHLQHAAELGVEPVGLQRDHQPVAGRGCDPVVVDRLLIDPAVDHRIDGQQHRLISRLGVATFQSLRPVTDRERPRGRQTEAAGHPHLIAANRHVGSNSHAVASGERLRLLGKWPSGCLGNCRDARMRKHQARRLVKVVAGHGDLNRLALPAAGRPDGAQAGIGQLNPDSQRHTGGNCQQQDRETMAVEQKMHRVEEAVRHGVVLPAAAADDRSGRQVEMVNVSG